MDVETYFAILDRVQWHPGGECTSIYSKCSRIPSSSTTPTSRTMSVLDQVINLGNIFHSKQENVCLGTPGTEKSMLDTIRTLLQYPANWRNKM